MSDKEKTLYFMCCIARDRNIDANYFDFDKRGQIANFAKENQEESNISENRCLMSCND